MRVFKALVSYPYYTTKVVFIKCEEKSEVTDLACEEYRKLYIWGMPQRSYISVTNIMEVPAMRLYRARYAFPNTIGNHISVLAEDLEAARDEALAQLYSIYGPRDIAPIISEIKEI